MTETTFTDDSGDVRFSGKIRMGGTAGQVATVQSNGTLAPAPGGGGSQTVRSVEVPIVFNTPGLASGGHAAVTLAAGESLADAAFLITTAWDGTTPTGDLGVATDSQGVFGTYGNGSPNGVDMSAASDSGDFTGLVAARAFQSLSFLAALSSIAGSSPGSGALPLRATGGPVNLVLWVTQDGTRGGASPGSAQGAAIIVLTILSP